MSCKRFFDEAGYYKESSLTIKKVCTRSQLSEDCPEEFPEQGSKPLTCLITNNDVASRLKTNVTINDLPREVIIFIFYMIPFIDRVKCVSFVCRLWRSIVMDSNMWRHIILNGYIKLTDKFLFSACNIHNNVISLNISNAKLVTDNGLENVLKTCHNIRVLDITQ